MPQHPKTHVLVVDNDHRLRMTLIDYLTEHGMRADGVTDGNAADAAMSAHCYSMILLDPCLPDGDGIDLLRRWCGNTAMSIICLTRRTEEADIVMGLELGADDYIRKPFSPREVLARMRAVMRRSQDNPIRMARRKQPRLYRFAGWSLNLNTRRLLSAAQRTVALTNVEFNLLAAFLRNARQTISRERLLETTRTFDDICDRAIDVQILRLRRKLEIDPRHPQLLRTERGMGYFFDAEVETVWE